MDLVEFGVLHHQTNIQQNTKWFGGIESMQGKL
jgi:hypothetical protein